MKKLSLVLASVLVSSLAFAKDSGKPKPSGSSVVVTNSNGSALFKLRYAAEKVQKHVRVTLFDYNQNPIYSETINKTDGFIRPYNFKDLPKGQYAVQVEDENGKVSEKINFNAAESTEGKLAPAVIFSKVHGDASKYAVLISSSQSDVVTINIFDRDNRLVYSEEAEVKGGFGKIYAMRDLKGFSIEISDSNGLVKSAKF